MARSKPIPLGPASEGPVLVQPTQIAAEPAAKPHFQTRHTKAPGINGGRRYVRKRLVEALPAITDTLVDRSIAGALAELKILVQLAGLDEKTPLSDPAERKFDGRYFEDILIEEWRKEHALESGNQPPGHPSATQPLRPN